MNNIIDGLSFNKGYFQSLISAIKFMKFKDEDNKYTKIEENKNEIFSILVSEINNLIQVQSNALIILYQNLISIIFNNDIESNKIHINGKISQKDAQTIYALLKNNFDIIIKCNQSNLYEIIFSSESYISPEIFYFKLVLSNQEDKKI